MQWLPTYMTRTLGAEKSHIMFTAVPYIMNSLVGMGEIFFAFETYNTQAPDVKNIVFHDKIFPVYVL